MSSTFPRALAGLLAARAYPHSVDEIVLVETHISWVLLAGQFAYKIKRPVRYPFIDMRSLERRKFLCHEELRLNRRFATDLYLEVSDITLLEGEARIGGSGPVLEQAVRMRRFDRGQQLDRLLAARAVEPGELADFGRRLAQIHAQLPVAAAHEPWGQFAHVRSLILTNLEQALQAAAPIGAAAGIEALRAPLLRQLEAVEPWVTARRAQGRVRECHGDLHARNVIRHQGHLMAFDCVEFEPAFRWIDLADETALLLTDLEARGHLTHAHAFWGGYLESSGDFQSHRVLALYKAHRALVRAKVAALSCAAAAPQTYPGGWREEQRRLIECARQALRPRTPVLLLMCGLSGSGKTWLAEQLAPRLQLVHLRSDVERKRPLGLGALAHSGSALQQGLYSEAATREVYARLETCAQDILAGGYGALVDATFARRADRARFRALAARLGVSLQLIHCHAPPTILRARIAERRRAAADASEADESVLSWQTGHFEPVGGEEALPLIDADTSDPQTPQRVLAALAAAGVIDT